MMIRSSRAAFLAGSAATAGVLGVLGADPADAGLFVGVSVRFGPPPLPVYVQPACPFPNAIWTPGYWAWGPAGYFWVPGTWVAAPAVGMLWTPGYWGWYGGGYRWYRGYWGPRVGFYGGINYGFGYFGAGYVGGGWFGGVFRYNTAVTQVNTTVIRNVYVNRTVINETVVNGPASRVAFNGGPGGVRAIATPDELAAANERRFGPTQPQLVHARVASHDRNLLASVNHGVPARPASLRPYSPEHRPEGFAPLQAGDRAYGRSYGRQGWSGERQSGWRPGSGPAHTRPAPDGERRRRVASP